MHKNLLSIFLRVYVSTLLGHPQGGSYIIHKTLLHWFISMLQGLHSTTPSCNVVMFYV